MFTLIKYLLSKTKTAPLPEVTPDVRTSQYEAVQELLRGYPVKGPSVQVLEVPKRGVNTIPTGLIALDTSIQQYLRKLKISPKRKEALESRLLAVNFLDKHFPGLQNIDDSLVASLESLLLVERRRGAKASRAVSRKKRK